MQHTISRDTASAATQHISLDEMALEHQQAQLSLETAQSDVTHLHNRIVALETRLHGINNESTLETLEP